LAGSETEKAPKKQNCPQVTCFRIIVGGEQVCAVP
jgi:hypothetical protein